jgi:hypothetical protein
MSLSRNTCFAVLGSERGAGALGEGAPCSRPSPPLVRPLKEDPTAADFLRDPFELQYDFAGYGVTLTGPHGRERVVSVGTTLTRERTRQGIGVGPPSRRAASALS